MPSTPTTGKRLYETNLGTIGRGSPTMADGKIYATEVNGNVHILKPLADKFETLSHVALKMPEGRHVEVWGSVAPAYGRLYLLTENYLYCLGDKKAPFKGPGGGSAFDGRALAEGADRTGRRARLHRAFPGRDLGGARREGRLRGARFRRTGATGQSPRGRLLARAASPARSTRTGCFRARRPACSRRARS